jgi:hypothetical protein
LFEVGDFGDFGGEAEFRNRLFGELREGFAFVAAWADDLDLHGLSFVF